MDKCPKCRAPVLHEGDKYQFDSSRYHMDAVKKLSEISAMKGYIEDLEAVVEAAKDVYEWSEPQSELQQVEMLILHDAMNAVQTMETPDG